MSAELVNGKTIADEIYKKIKVKINNFKEHNLELPVLEIIQVGNESASTKYAELKKLSCEKLGIKCNITILENNISELDLKKIIFNKSSDANVNGILVQFPLPNHINPKNIVNLINPDKDVDCLNPMNLGNIMWGENNLLPATINGIFEILKYHKIEICKKNIVVIGRSKTVGLPLANLLINCDATVTVCHSKTVNLKEITKKAEILIVAIGKALFINSEFIKNNAIVIDVGYNVLQGKPIGDVNLDKKVLKKVKLITPVPNGVGPVTIASLIYNLFILYENQKKSTNI